jgi:hypothetical protein
VRSVRATFVLEDGYPAGGVGLGSMPRRGLGLHVKLMMANVFATGKLVIRNQAALTSALSSSCSPVKGASTHRIPCPLVPLRHVRHDER